MFNPTLNFMVIAFAFASYWGTQAEREVQTGEIIFMAVITRICGQVVPMLFGHHSYIWAKGRSVSFLQQSPNLCNAFPDKELL